MSQTIESKPREESPSGLRIRPRSNLRLRPEGTSVKLNNMMGSDVNLNKQFNQVNSSNIKIEVPSTKANFNRQLVIPQLRMKKAPTK